MTFLRGFTSLIFLGIVAQSQIAAAAVPLITPAQFSCDVGSLSSADGVRTTTLDYSEATGEYTELTYKTSPDGSSQKSSKRVIDGRVRFERSPAMPRAFNLVARDGSTLATLEVYGGHPLRPQVRLLLNDSSRPCVVNEGGAALYERLIDDPAMLSQIAAWKAWVAARPAACDPQFQSLGYFTPGATKTALVLHGYSSNPLRMNEVTKVLLENGYNVLAPRLSRHFTKNLHDLDNSKAAEWQRDAEESFTIARKFSSTVTVVGYSLGGLLASRLALVHPEQIDRMVLIAPAWRIRSDMSWGTMIGSFLGISMNDLRNESVSCTAEAGYQPAIGGRQIERLITATEKRFGSLTDERESAFRQIRVPHLLFTSPADEAVDSSAVNQLCQAAASPCTLAELAGRSHTDMLTSMKVRASRPHTHLTMGELIAGFVNGKTK